jgi:serine/threonine-protein kinase
LAAGQQQNALDSFKQMLKIDPQDRSAHGRIAEIYEGRKDFPAAIKELTLQMTYSPEGKALFKRAQLYRQLSQYENAEKDYSTLVKRFPNDADAHRYRGEVLAALGKYQDAADQFSAAIKIDPETAAVYKDRAQAYDKLGKKDLAAQDLKTASQLP